MCGKRERERARVVGGGRSVALGPSAVTRKNTPSQEAEFCSFGNISMRPSVAALATLA